MKLSNYGIEFGRIFFMAELIGMWVVRLSRFLDLFFQPCGVGFNINHGVGLIFKATLASFLDKDSHGWILLGWSTFGLNNWSPLVFSFCFKRVCLWMMCYFFKSKFRWVSNFV